MQKTLQTFIIFVEPECNPSVVEVQATSVEAETVSVLIGYLQPEKEAKIFDRLFYYIPLETKKKVLPVTEEMRNARYLVLHTQDDKRFAFSAIGTPQEYTVEELQAMGYNAGKHGIRYLGFELLIEPTPPFDINAIELREGDERRAPDFKRIKKKDISKVIQKCLRKTTDTYKVLSLFSGCGGMDLGFEGLFLAPKKSFVPNSPWIEADIDKNWVLLKKNKFRTVFANDILPEAKKAWITYMERFGHTPEIYHNISIVDLVKMHEEGANVFPKDIDVVTGGFPCQDFSVAGKRKGFESGKDHMGQKRQGDEASEETRGKLYYWMKQVIDITRPKVFIAENVKGLVNLGNVKDIIQQDFASADGNGYIVLNPQVLHAGNYGVPEMRERVIFIGIRKDALRPEALKALDQQEIPAKYNPYPVPTHAATINDDTLLPIVTVRDIFQELKEPDCSSDESQQIYSKAKYLAGGSQGQIEVKLGGLAPTIRSEHHGNIEFRRLSQEHGGKYHEELKRGYEERRLTPRECALIQTFPPDYRFVIKNTNKQGMYISSSAAYKIIGNAVPPVLAYHIAARLEELWPLYFTN